MYIPNISYDTFIEDISIRLEDLARRINKFRLLKSTDSEPKISNNELNEEIHICRYTSNIYIPANKCNHYNNNKCMIDWKKCNSQTYIPKN